MGDGLKRVAKHCGGLVAKDKKQTVTYDANGRIVSMKVGKKAPFDIKKWLNDKLKDARKESKAADKARDESDYRDIDAMEQYYYNDGVIDTLIELRTLLR